MRKWFGWIYTVAVLVFLYAPIAVMIAMSLNESRYNQLPFRFSTRWYEALADNVRLLAATRYSISLAAVTAAICVVLGTALIYGISRSGRRKRRAVQTLVVVPLTIPWIILGVSLLLMLRALGLQRNLAFLLAGHVVVCLPYFALVLLARLDSLDRSLEDASCTLGANPGRTFLRISLPVLAPGILAGAFLAFLVSFNMFVISYFLIRTGLSTLPIQIYTAIKFGFTPEINAVSTIILLLSVVVFAAIASLARGSVKAFTRENRRE